MGRLGALIVGKDDRSDSIVIAEFEHFLRGFIARMLRILPVKALEVSGYGHEIESRKSGKQASLLTS